MRIVHVTTALATGGAQMMMAKLLEADGGRHSQMVVSLQPGGGLWGRVAATGVELHHLGLAPGRLSLKAVARLRQLLRRWRPDLVHGWMYHGNLAGLAGARLAYPGLPVLWNIRHSLHDLGLEKPATRRVIRIGAPLSRLAAALVYNSSLSAAQHRGHGYGARHVEVVPNGFDTDLFRPDAAAGAALRQELGLGPATALVGLVARYHPMKDHGTMLRAAARLLAAGADFRLVLVGPGMTADNGDLVRLIGEQGLGRHVALLGERSDMPRLVAGLDIATLCSAWGEGFPNVLGEAMAAGVPCVATAIGDCRPLLEGVGEVVAPQDPEALAGALGVLLRLSGAERRARGLSGRERILRDYALAAIVRRYDRLYEAVAAPPADRRRAPAESGSGRRGLLDERRPARHHPR